MIGGKLILKNQLSFPNGANVITGVRDGSFVLKHRPEEATP